MFRVAVLLRGEGVMLTSHNFWIGTHNVWCWSHVCCIWTIFFSRCNHGPVFIGLSHKTPRKYIEVYNKMWKSSRGVNAFTRNCTTMVKSNSLSSAGCCRAKDLENALRKYFSPSAWSSPESVWAGRGCSAPQRLETPESSRRRNGYWLRTENIWLGSQRLKKKAF